MNRALGFLIYGLASALGLLAFAWPFVQPGLAQSTDAGASAHGADAPWLLAVLVAACLLALLYEAQSNGLDTKLIALLGVLVALNSALRFIENVMPGPGGFTPIFVLIVLCGHVFGARFGFLMGALTLLVSAFVTGGVGPWLPYQMFTAGWMGASAGLLRHALPRGPSAELAGLIVFVAAWGFLYGAIINLWFWPLQRGAPDQSFQAGMSAFDVLRRYATFYVVTSFGWDAFGALGSAGMMLLFGAPMLRVLRRFQRRFTFHVVEVAPA